MAGSILGRDQVEKINAAYPILIAHIRELLTTDQSAHGLMKVHVLTEYLDTTALATIFSGLSFISPAEKRALVRAAIYEVLITSSRHLTAIHATEFSDAQVVMEEIRQAAEAKAFTPPQFRLNVNKASDIKGDSAKDTPPPAPVITNTAGTIAQRVQDMKNEGAKQAAAVQADHDLAVAHLRTVPEPIQEIEGK